MNTPITIGTRRELYVEGWRALASHRDAECWNNGRRLR